MHIGLVGTFDVDNFGDCMFPELYDTLLREALPDVTLTLYSPRPTPATILSYDRLVALPATLDQTRRMQGDALILVGGETLGFGHSSGTYNYPRQALSSYLRLWAAPLYSTLTDGGAERFIAHCVGAIKMGPELNRTVARALSGATHCSFRDSFSQSWVRDGDFELGQATDPMFLMDHLLSPEDWRARAQAQLQGQAEPGGYLAAQISFGYGRNDLNGWCDAVAGIARARALKVALLPICHFLEDEFYLSAAENRLKSLGIETVLIRGRINVKDTAAVLSQAAGYIGSSLHGAVGAVAFGMPLAVLGHSMDGKHEGTLNSVGVAGCTTTEPGGLAACFAKSEGLDRAAVRDRAQAQARAGFDQVLAALTATPRENAQARAAIEQLVAWERDGTHQIEQVSEAKRFALRQIYRNASVQSLYHRTRLRQRIAKATR